MCTIPKNRVVVSKSSKQLKNGVQTLSIPQGNVPEEKQFSEEDALEFCYSNEYKTKPDTSNKQTFDSLSEDKPKCEICHKVFNSNYRLREHCVIHTDERPHSCKECGETFRWRSSLQEHRKYHEMPMGLQKQECSGEDALEFHNPNENEIQHDIANSPKSGNFVTATFQWSPSLEIKPNVSESPGKKKHSCLSCGNRFEYRHSLRIHIERVHLNSNDYECIECGKCFKNFMAKKAHEKEVHKIRILSNRNAEFSCAICKCLINDSKLLRSHIGEKHKLESKIYSCPECQKNFKADISLRKHIWDIHFKVKDYQCTDCQEFFLGLICFEADFL